MRRGSDVWRLTRRPVLEAPGRLPGPGTVGPQPQRPAHSRPWQSLRGLGRSMLRDERAVTLLDRYATYTGSDPGALRQRS